MRKVIKAVEDAFREKGLGRVQMPPKLYVFYQKYHGDMRSMPCYLEAFDVSAVKVVNAHPFNRAEHDLPTVMATIILIDPKTGFPLAVMDGTHITNMRTGAAGAVASKYLAKREPRVVGLVGAGAQARTQLMSHAASCESLDAVRVWSPNREEVERFVEEAKDLYGNSISIASASTVEETVKEADIVITCTPSREPLVKREWVIPGMHFNCVGADAPGKEELEPSILKGTKIVVDDWEQAAHSGEINVPLSKGTLNRNDVYGEIGEVVSGLKPGRRSPDEITIFCSTGLAIQDAVTAKLVYDEAKERNIGMWIELVSE